MEERYDTEMMVERAREIAQAIRKSEAYPALVGGIAGGIAGALMAALIASRFAPREELPPESTPASERRQSARAGFDVRQTVELLAVVAGLVKQAREWYSKERKR
jgi:hypothetical protein